jgi:hypothetical protein
MARKTSKASSKESDDIVPPNEAGSDTPTTPSKPSAKNKAAGAAKKTTSRKPAAVKRSATAANPADPSDDEIRLRAYFIAESRNELSKPGDETTDWLEARQQLYAEAGIPLP